MNARVIMNKKAEGYEWLVIDLHTLKVLETFPAGNVNGAHEAMDRYNAEAEDAARNRIIADDEGRGRYPVFRQEAC